MSRSYRKIQHWMTGDFADKWRRQKYRTSVGLPRKPGFPVDTWSELWAPKSKREAKREQGKIRRREGKKRINENWG